MSSLRSSCQLPLSPPLAKLPALAAPKQNLELGMGKGVPARERAGTKYWCLFFTVVFFSLRQRGRPYGAQLRGLAEAFPCLRPVPCPSWRGLYPTMEGGVASTPGLNCWSCWLSRSRELVCLSVQAVTQLPLSPPIAQLGQPPQLWLPRPYPKFGIGKGNSS